MRIFNPDRLMDLYRSENNSSNEDNGSVSIIGGSTLFHGAPILALKVASRIVDMVFFASPERSVGEVATQLKSQLPSFIWVPWDEINAYIEKSDAVLIGPGFMRFTSESQNPNDKIQMTNDREGQRTREITERVLKKFPDKKWVIDAGSLQVMDKEWIPQKAVLTPNYREFELLFDLKTQNLKLKTTTQISKLVQDKAIEHQCIIVLKGPETIVASPDGIIIVKGGNAGLTKGGTGDVLAGLTVALLANNDPSLAARSASYIEKMAADELYKKVGTNYNADDLADKIPETTNKVLGNRS